LDRPEQFVGTLLPFAESEIALRDIFWSVLEEKQIFREMEESTGLHQWAMPKLLI
jgi:hypothetical protein